MKDNCPCARADRILCEAEFCPWHAARPKAPPGLKEHIEAAAAANGVLPSYIAAMIRACIGPDDPYPALLDEMARSVSDPVTTSSPPRNRTFY